MAARLTFARLLAALAFAMLALAMPLRAQDQAAQAAPLPEPPTAVVPYDPGAPLEGQSPKRVYLDYETFQRLWKAAKEVRARAEAETKAATGERAATVSSALHAARVDGNKLVVEARFTLLTRGPEWIAIPFKWDGVSVRSVTVDGDPAAVRDAQLIIEKPGMHAVVAQYEVPLPAGWTEVAWGVPAASASSLALNLAMDDPARPEINGGVPVVETTADGRRVFTATLGATSRIVLRRQLDAQRAGGVAGDPPLVTWRKRLFVTAALERLEASAEFAFAGQGRREFTLRLDPALTPVSFDIPGLETWSLRKEAAAQHLDFRLVAPVRDAFTAKLVAERAVAALPATLEFPRLEAAAARTEHEASLLVTDELEVRPQPGPQWRQIPFVSMTAEQMGGFTPVATFAAAGSSPPLAYDVRARVVERRATTSYVFQVSRGKFELSAGLQLKPAAGEDLLEATVRLPENLTIQGVAGDRLADWWREGDALRLRFSGATPETTMVTLNLTRPLAPEATDVSFAPLKLDGFAKIDGTGLLVAPLSLDTTLSFDQPRTIVRETAPEEANRGFTVLTPFEIKRGFTFTADGWVATAKLTPVPPQFEADWVLDAEAHEGFIALNANVLIRLRRGAVSAVAFTLPASVPEMEVHGDDLREVTSVIEGTVRRYTATLQRETNSPVLFTLSGELPHAGTASLPDLDIPGATKIERFVIIENKSDGRLDVKRQGLTECPRGELSFLPEELAASQKPAQFFRAQPGWSAALTLEALPTTAGQAAVVLEADLTTSLLINGDEWVRAVYRLHNRSLQFLPIVLPSGAQLVAVTVAGQPSRADAGVKDGTAVTLIPLIQTKPGERSVEVSLVYLVHGAPPKNRVFDRTLDDPDLPGLSIQQTFWTVQLPDGFHLRDATGTMTRIESDSFDAEKWLARLAESASLISLSSRSGYDATTKKEALENSDQVLAEQRRNLESNVKLATPGNEAYAQVAEELNKQQELLTENYRKLAEEEKAAPQTTGELETKTGVARKKFLANSLDVSEFQNKPAADVKPDASQVGFNDNVFWDFKPAPPPTDPSKPQPPTDGKEAAPQQAQRASGGLASLGSWPKGTAGSSSRASSSNSRCPRSLPIQTPSKGARRSRRSGRWRLADRPAQQPD